MLNCEALITHSGIKTAFHSVLLPLLLESGPSLQCLHPSPSVIIIAGHALECLATSIAFTRQPASPLVGPSGLSDVLHLKSPSVSSSKVIFLVL